jgi:HD-GYP domain-containing protein (c-di-GMP phosphodiesterase class II)
MFVYRLDRPWEGTPFPLQGFTIDTLEQIDALRKLCDEVTIDVIRSRAARDARARESQQPGVRQIMQRQLDRLADSRTYTDTTPLSEELPRASAAQARLGEYAGQVLEDVRAGKPLVPAQVTAAVTPVVKSVLRSADALFWLNTLRERGDYEYSHALHCTILAAAFGRHLGLPEPMLVRIAGGALLLDIGKTQLPVELLTYPGPLDARQTAMVQRHVELSLEILRISGQTSPEVIDMVGAHHERVDGSGYPRGLQGAEIPLLGRMAAIIDTFDAMTSDRPYRKGISRHDALQQLYALRDRLFQAELVERFIQCIGVYPTGSLVELSSGEVAVVQAQNRTRQLLPRVLVITTPDKQLDRNFREVDLIVEASREVGAIRIVRTLEPGAHGLDPTELFL